jgi:protein TonB
MVRVLVSAEGLPKNVGLEKTSGFTALDEAALSAVQSWRFVPAREGGQAVEALYTVPVVYRLN